MRWQVTKLSQEHRRAILRKAVTGIRVHFRCENGHRWAVTVKHRALCRIERELVKSIRPESERIEASECERPTSTRA